MQISSPFLNNSACSVTSDDQCRRAVGSADIRKQVWDQTGHLKQIPFHLSSWNRRTRVRLWRFSAIRATFLVWGGISERHTEDITGERTWVICSSYFTIFYLLQCKIWRKYIRSHSRLGGRGTRDWNFHFKCSTNQINYKAEAFLKTSNWCWLMKTATCRREGWLGGCGPLSRLSVASINPKLTVCLR